MSVARPLEERAGAAGPRAARSGYAGPQVLRATAAALLRSNDLGGRTRASATLYPHQWSWDSAFIAIGLAHLDTDRAAAELSSLFEAQWSDGRVPHIVFDPSAPAGSYVPSLDHWVCAAPPAGRDGSAPASSGLIQPPAHAIAARHVWRAARRRGAAASARARAFLRDLYPRLLAWHRYLLTARDPEGSGLITIYHPWESGWDNSPRWDAALAVITPGPLPAYRRADLDHVADAVQRPTARDYQRYLWLVGLLRAVCYDDEAVYPRHPFLVKDVLASALLVAANEALREIAELVGAPGRDRAQLRRWIRRGRQGLDGCWDPRLGLCVDFDLRADRPLRACTAAGFAPLIAGSARRRRLADLLATLDSPAFLGHPRLRWRLPPSTSPLDPGFAPRSYWRGPVWPVVNWLLWWSLRRAGEHDRAQHLGRQALGQLAAVDGFPEYVDPFTGEPLGSPAQSWTAAVTLDWLAAGLRPDAADSGAATA